MGKCFSTDIWKKYVEVRKNPHKETKVSESDWVVSCRNANFLKTGWIVCCKKLWNNLVGPTSVAKKLQYLTFTFLTLLMTSKNEKFDDCTWQNIIIYNYYCTAYGYYLHRFYKVTQNMIVDKTMDKTNARTYKYLMHWVWSKFIISTKYELPLSIRTGTFTVLTTSTASHRLGTVGVGVGRGVYFIAILWLNFKNRN